jgi:hypothetical protein
MRPYIRGVTLALGSLWLVLGCATSPISARYAEDVPASRIMQAAALHERPGTGRVIVTRDAGFMGGACSYVLYLDATPVVALRGGERVLLYVDPGTHMLSTHASGMCGGGTAEVETTVHVDHAKRYRISSGQDGTLALMPTAF